MIDSNFPSAAASSAISSFKALDNAMRPQWTIWRILDLIQMSNPLHLDNVLNLGPSSTRILSGPRHPVLQDDALDASTGNHPARNLGLKFKSPAPCRMACPKTLVECKQMTNGKTSVLRNRAIRLRADRLSASRSINFHAAAAQVDAAQLGDDLCAFMMRGEKLGKLPADLLVSCLSRKMLRSQWKG